MTRALWWGAGALWAGALTIVSGSAISPTWAESHALGRAEMVLLAGAVTLTLTAWARRRQTRIEVAYDLGELAGTHGKSFTRDHENARDAP